MYSLKKLAKILNGKLQGKDTIIYRLSSLLSAQQGSISFLVNPKYLYELKKTRASAVLLTEEALEFYSGCAIVVSNPYLSFVKLANFFKLLPIQVPGIHSTVVCSKDSTIGPRVSIGAFSVIGKGVLIDEGVTIGSGSVISDFSYIGKHSTVKDNVSIYYNTYVGNDCIIHSNTVIGSDGFGNIKDNSGQWIKIPHMGGVRIGNKVEIGAGTTIDRGTIDNTVISCGVKIDNQIQIAHNVTIGNNTAIASLTGIAGSVKIGKNCLIGGQVGISDHISICDNVVLSAASKVSKDIVKPGFYSGAFNARLHMNWKRMNARVFNLRKLEDRIKILEKFILSERK
jgi:UDP-3-O-[3-hydroxymyristoyl] glucosamine N-acyltransferase